MSSPRTHYDSLKVAPDAPAEVVRAAYRVLAQKYHPDRNPGDATAAAAMVVVNEAYRVLSDPELRQQYDIWLRSLAAMRDSKDVSAGVRPTGSPSGSRGRSSSEEEPENLHTEHIPGSRSVDLDQVWESWFGRSSRSVPPADTPENPHTENVPGSRTVDLDRAWDGFFGLFKPSRSKTPRGRT